MEQGGQLLGDWSSGVATGGGSWGCHQWSPPPPVATLPRLSCQPTPACGCGSWQTWWWCCTCRPSHAGSESPPAPAAAAQARSAGGHMHRVRSQAGRQASRRGVQSAVWEQQAGGACSWGRQRDPPVHSSRRCPPAGAAEPPAWSRGGAADNTRPQLASSITHSPTLPMHLTVSHSSSYSVPHSYFVSSNSSRWPPHCSRQQAAGRAAQ